MASAFEGALELPGLVAYRCPVTAQGDVGGEGDGLSRVVLATVHRFAEGASSSAVLTW